MPIIAADNLFALGAIIFGLAWLGFWVDGNAIGKKVAGVVWVLIGGGLLSNTGVIPLTSGVYDFVGGYLVPLAIPLLLFKANLVRIFKEGGKVLIIFPFAAFATLLGAVVGFYLIDLGASGAKFAGIYTGGYIGGAMNMVAIKEAVEMTQSDFSVALSASSPVSIIALLTLLALPSFALVQRWIPSRFIGKEDEAASTDQQPERDRVRPAHLTGAIALSFGICAISYLVAELLGISQFSILFVTAFAVLAANVAPKVLSQLEGEFDLGMLLMYVFFAVVGAGTDLSVFIDTAMFLFFYALLIIVVHIVFMLGVARIFKFDLAETIIASGAALVGAAPSAAIASARGWKDLITPAIMCGVLGYVIANFVGVSLTSLLS